MRYVLEIRNQDGTKEESIHSEEDSRIRYNVAISLMPYKVKKVIMWREFDNIEEAARHNDKCVYYIGKKHSGIHAGKRTLRNCCVATG